MVIAPLSVTEATALKRDALGQQDVVAPYRGDKWLLVPRPGHVPALTSHNSSISEPERH